MAMEPLDVEKGGRRKTLDIGQAITLLANIGVILSLVFVGIQIRQSAQATRSATIFELKNSWVELNLAGATNADLAKAFDDVYRQGWDASAFETRFLVAGYYRAMIHNWSTAYFQYRQGTLDDEQWAPYLREMEKDANDPIVRRIWADWRYIYDDSFQALFDGMVVDAAKKQDR